MSLSRIPIPRSALDYDLYCSPVVAADGAHQGQEPEAVGSADTRATAEWRLGRHGGLGRDSTKFVTYWSR